jgi:hypothetical protein
MKLPNVRTPVRKALLVSRLKPRPEKTRDNHLMARGLLCFNFQQWNTS